MKRFGTEKEINMDDDDIEFVVHQVWRSRCASTNRRFGGHVILTLTRWDASLPPSPSNLVLMMQNEAQKLHEIGRSAFPDDVVARISERLAWAKRVCEDSWETLDHTGGQQACPVVDKPVRGAGIRVPSDARIGYTCIAPMLGGATAAFLLGYGASRFLNK